MWGSSGVGILYAWNNGREVVGIEDGNLGSFHLLIGELCVAVCFGGSPGRGRGRFVDIRLVAWMNWDL